jgi:glutaredoxin
MAGALVTLVVMPSHAQQVYRIVSPSGRVTFTDKPPAEDGKSKITTVASSLPPGSSNTANLPFELQAVANKYPVTLYTTNNCSVCIAARNYLVGRGIPIAEKTVNGPEEIEAFQKLAGETTMPFLTIGSQQLKGFVESDWSQYLTAAAYPTNSALPPGYKYAPAAPIIPKKEFKADPPPAQAATQPDVPAAAPSTPGGIRF